MADPNAIRLTCPGCGARYVLRKAAPAGRKVLCKKCGRPLEEPEKDLRLKGESREETWEIPVRHGKLIVEGEVGRGGMGVLYKARQEGLDRMVAVKMMLRGAASTPEDLHRFHREMKAAAKLRHPNIVSAHEYGEFRNAPFFTMDLVDGRGLDKVLEDGPMKPERGAEILRDVARAIQYAHGEGIIHRDLKPANILIDLENRPRITDFGLARDMDSKSLLSMTGEVMGTPAYMSPEQAEGRVHEIGPPSDVYSMGAILYRILTGKPPFEGPTVAATIYKVVNDYTTDPHRLNPKVQTDLSAVCMKALEKETDRRYATAGEFAEDLDRYLRGEPVSAKPLSGWDRIRRRIRKHRVAFRISAVSIGTAVAAVLALVLFGGESYLEFVERNLKSKDANIRLETLTALLEDFPSGKFSGDDLERARKLFREAIARNTDEKTRGRVLAALERNPDARLPSDLVRTLEMAEPKELQLRTIALMAKHKVQEAVDGCMRLLNVPDHEVHHAAVRFFIAVPHLRAFSPLGRLVADPKCGPDARLAIRDLYNNDVITFISPASRGMGGAVAALGETFEAYNRQMQDLLHQQGRTPRGPRDAVEAAMKELKSSATESRLRAAIELGMHADERAADALLQACEDPDDAIARAAGVALRDCGAAKHRDALVALLAGERPAVRIAAASALGGVKGEEVENALAARLGKEKDKGVRDVLLKALRRD